MNVVPFTIYARREGNFNHEGDADLFTTKHTKYTKPNGLFNRRDRKERKDGRGFFTTLLRPSCGTSAGKRMGTDKHGWNGCEKGRDGH
jgi:hypothetical protein